MAKLKVNQYNMVILSYFSKLTLESDLAVNQENERFPDLADLPPELGLAVLSHLNATDLCLAACVWNDLAHDEMLWMGYLQFSSYTFRFNPNKLCLKIVQEPVGLLIDLPRSRESVEIV